jgi:hypothetical protein
LSLDPVGGADESWGIARSRRSARSGRGARRPESQPNTRWKSDDERKTLKNHGAKAMNESAPSRPATR